MTMPGAALYTSPVHRMVLRGEIPGYARPAVFLDRDGVVNVDKGHVHQVQDFEFMPDALTACRQLACAGFALVVVTNQAGIARGWYGIEDFLRLSEWMAARFLEAGAPLDGIYFCPHHPWGSVPALAEQCACRKPEPGLILTAAEDLRLDLSRSALVGDKWSDIAAGKRAGVGSCLLLRAPAGSAGPERDIAAADAVVADREVTGLADAAEYLSGMRVGVC
ncbi:MAG TPA: D-glycero-beta-D-manno-heptose 1,7-bisphosphate 7-phosphatase [Steroidobacteraceae bacterium]|nr:D-glycero-beta-D-manno-heptose 1,7-bisphosphate 7-phosphatase [Steroidobacteraceae bacterium]